MIYLDHAATSFPKPAAVADAVHRWFTAVGVSGERGEGPNTREARAVVQHTRERLAAMLAVQPSRVAFVSGATEGLNLVLRAVVQRGAKVLTTPFEHSSVVRPLRALQDERGVDVCVTGAAADGVPDTAALIAAIDSGGFDVLVFTHASNVTGAAFDAAALCAAARRRGVCSVVDASQSAGLLPIDCGADVLVASAHKALHGPPGLGFVACRGGFDLAPQKHGGTGSAAALDRHPSDWPQAFEAGTPNTPAIFGLAAALDWLLEHPPGALLQQALAPLDELREQLSALTDFRFWHASGSLRIPVLSLVHAHYDPLELGALLAGAGIHARAGFHCAPWLHEVLGTTRGTLRISTGPHTDAAEVGALLEVLRSL